MPYLLLKNESQGGEMSQLPKPKRRILCPRETGTGSGWFLASSKTNQMYLNEKI